MGFAQVLHAIRRLNEMNDHSSLAAADLLAILAAENEGMTGKVLPTARDFLKSRGINALGDLCQADLEELGVCDDAIMNRMLAAFELGRRAGSSNKGELKHISRASEIAKSFEYLRNENQEHLCAMFFNSRMGVLGTRTITIGTLTQSLVGIREVFREALRCGASSVVVVHNHPSGDPQPSPEDIAVTQRLKEAGELLDVALIDHIIIGHHTYTSFAETHKL